MKTAELEAPQTASTGTVKRTISLAPHVARLGSAGAARTKRNFSNFIALLITTDAEAIEKEQQSGQEAVTA
ncbi:MAG TPA: hypothetical protein VK474_11610 [Chthoniobacterales bacterium]|nr:hypothetical protein [Chthoniobacterales bacterium]